MRLALVFVFVVGPALGQAVFDHRSHPGPMIHADFLGPGEILASGELEPGGSLVGGDLRVAMPHDYRGGRPNSVAIFSHPRPYPSATRTEAGPEHFVFRAYSLATYHHGLTLEFRYRDGALLGDERQLQVVKWDFSRGTWRRVNGQHHDLRANTITVVPHSDGLWGVACRRGPLDPHYPGLNAPAEIGAAATDNEALRWIAHRRVVATEGDFRTAFGALSEVGQIRLLIAMVRGGWVRWTPGTRPEGLLRSVATRLDFATPAVRYAADRLARRIDPTLPPAADLPGAAVRARIEAMLGADPFTTDGDRATWHAQVLDRIAVLPPSVCGTIARAYRDDPALTRLIRRSCSRRFSITHAAYCCAAIGTHDECLAFLTTHFVRTVETGGAPAVVDMLERHPALAVALIRSLNPPALHRICTAARSVPSWR